MKIRKNIVATAALFGSNHALNVQILRRLRLRPDLSGGAYSTPPGPLAVFRGLVLRARGERKGRKR